MATQTRPDPPTGTDAGQPEIDIGPLLAGGKAARATVVEAIRQASEAPGFFHLRNNAVDATVISGAFEAAQRFFALDDEDPVKQAVHNRFAERMKGWGPRYGEPAYQPGTVANVESFDIGQPLSNEECAGLGFPPNPWPDIEGFRPAVECYYSEATRLARALAEVFSELLHQDRSFINDHSGPSAPRTMRLLHYPGGDTPPDRRHVGISAHTDFEVFTLMQQTAPGLELTDNRGRWRPAPGDGDAFTVILGDMMERLSNGHYRATGHRVRITPWKRYSLVLFFALDNAYEVAPLPAFVDARNPPRFTAISQGAHIAAELARAAGPTAD